MANLNTITNEEAFTQYKDLNLAEERRKSNGRNDFDLLRQLLQSFDIKLIEFSNENLSPNVKVCYSYLSFCSYNITFIV